MFDVTLNSVFRLNLFSVTLIQIALGSDNLRIIIILANKLPVHQRKKAVIIGPPDCHVLSHPAVAHGKPHPRRWACRPPDGQSQRLPLYPAMDRHFHSPFDVYGGPVPDWMERK